MMKLIDAPDKIRITLLQISASDEVRRRLNTMGLYINDVLVRMNDSRWGPILIQNLSNRSSKIALGRRLAEKIFVELNIK